MAGLRVPVWRSGGMVVVVGGVCTLTVAAGVEELTLLFVTVVLLAFLGACLAPAADLLIGGPILGGFLLRGIVVELPVAIV